MTSVDILGSCLHAGNPEEKSVEIKQRELGRKAVLPEVGTSRGRAGQASRTAEWKLPVYSPEQKARKEAGWLWQDEETEGGRKETRI